MNDNTQLNNYNTQLDIVSVERIDAYRAEYRAEMMQIGTQNRCNDAHIYMSCKLLKITLK